MRNESETRAELIDPALAAAGWCTLPGSRIQRELTSLNCPRIDPSLPNDYDASGNQLCSYDPSGAFQTTYTYDAENRISTSQNAGVSTTYVYNADGTRDRKFNPDGTTTYYLYFRGELITESDRAANFTNYLYAGDRRIARLAPLAPGAPPSISNLTFTLSDHLGSASIELTGDGQPLRTRAFKPYGEEISDQATIDNPDNHYKFTGKERDIESGLDYFGARYYNSTNGRFMSPDWSDKPQAVPYSSLGNPQSLNLYGYVGNNPMNSIDSDGHLDGPNSAVDKTYGDDGSDAFFNDPSRSSAGDAPQQMGVPASVLERADQNHQVISGQQQETSSGNSQSEPSGFSVDFKKLWKSGHWESKLGGGFGFDFDVAHVAQLNAEATVTRTYGTSDGTTFNGSGALAGGLLGLTTTAEAGYKYDPVYSKWNSYHEATNKLSFGGGLFVGLGASIHYQFGANELRAVAFDIFRRIDQYVPDWVRVRGKD